MNICEWHCCRKEFIPRQKRQRFCKANCKVANSVAIKRIRHKQKAVDYLGGKCNRCSYNKSLKALCFHHLEGHIKDSTISVMIANNKIWRIIQRELDKCELLCANCHMEEHDSDI